MNLIIYLLKTFLISFLVYRFTRIRHGTVCSTISFSAFAKISSVEILTLAKSTAYSWDLALVDINWTVFTGVAGARTVTSVTVDPVYTPAVVLARWTVVCRVDYTIVFVDLAVVPDESGHTITLGHLKSSSSLKLCPSKKSHSSKR